MNAAHGASTSAPLDLVRSVRAQGCKGHAGNHVPLRPLHGLDEAAQELSRGVALESAIAHAGYRQEQSASIHVSGDTSVLQRALSNQLCTTIIDASFADIGIATHGRDTWIIFAEPFSPPAAAMAGQVGAELLQRINAARAQARRCGSKPYPPAPPLRANAMLQAAAEAHARDMLVHNYFAHEGHDGSSPADRVTATGYGYRLVGENIASGPETAAQAADGWIASPDHCENLMDPRFVESGVAYAASTSGPPRIYWVQEFATPR